MTISEKIQHYRKSAGLSQEELAKNLLVSRQTISLWENGQTLPTIDNLIRLKEIFGISLDEMLCSDNTCVPIKPIESFDESYTSISHSKCAELLKRTLLFPKLVILALSVIVFSALITYVALKDVSGAIGILMLILTAAALSVIAVISYGIFATLREIRTFSESADGTASYVRINSEYLIIETVTDGKTQKLTKIPHSKARISNTSKGVITLTAEGRKTYLSESVVRSDSILLSLKKKEFSINKVLCACAALTLVLISAIVLDLSVNTPVLKIEKLSGISIPEYVGITEKESIGIVGDSYVEYTAEIFLNQEGARELEKKLITSEMWESIQDNNSISSLAPDVSMYNGADYFSHKEYKDSEHILLVYFLDEKLLKAIIYTKEM